MQIRILALRKAATIAVMLTLVLLAFTNVIQAEEEGQKPAKI